MSFLTYQDVRPWAQATKGAVLKRQMPPWFADLRFGHFSNQRKLSDADITRLVRWADTGAAEGDAKDRPALVEFSADGLTIKPDPIFAMPKPYDVPTNWVIEYT